MTVSIVSIHVCVILCCSDIFEATHNTAVIDHHCTIIHHLSRARQEVPRIRAQSDGGPPRVSQLSDAQGTLITIAV